MKEKMDKQEHKWFAFPGDTPTPGILCLCKVKHQFNASSDYRIAFYGAKPNCTLGNQFWFYDLLITNDVLSFMPLENDFKYFK